MMSLNMKWWPILQTNNLSSSNFASLLQKCTKAKAPRPSRQVHALLLASGIDMYSFSLNSKLVGAYASSGDLTSATLVFQRTQYPNVFAFNWMISALAFHGYYEQAIGYFSLSQVSRIVVPNSYTFSFVLKACIGLMDLKMGMEVHCVIKKVGFDLDVMLGNALIDMYCKCGSTSYAHKVFDRMSKKDVVSWTSMISGYSSVGELHASAELFEKMRLIGLEPNEFTWNALIAGYAKSGDCDGAFMLFSRMSRERMVPDLVAWNAMVSGFVQSQRCVEAVELFTDMLVAGIKPNHVTVTGLLPACGLMGLINRGKEIHGLIHRMNLHINVFVASALIDMYSKCGYVKGARNVFENIPVKNVASWNAMIGCYGKQGLFNAAIHLFERMQYEKVQANQVTLTCVLSSCSHGGLVEEGMMIFRSMKERYGVEICEEHYACVVDLLCRHGRIESAYELVKEMHVKVTDSIIGAFLNGCVIYKRRDLAKQLTNDIMRMKLKRPGALVTLSNIYAGEGEWEEAESLRKVMKEHNVHKKPGFSWVEKWEDSKEVVPGKGISGV